MKVGDKVVLAVDVVSQFKDKTTGKNKVYARKGERGTITACHAEVKIIQLDNGTAISALIEELIPL